MQTIAGRAAASLGRRFVELAHELRAFRRQGKDGDEGCREDSELANALRGSDSRAPAPNRFTTPPTDRHLDGTADATGMRHQPFHGRAAIGRCKREHAAAPDG